MEEYDSNLLPGLVAVKSSNAKVATDGTIVTLVNSRTNRGVDLLRQNPTYRGNGSCHGLCYIHKSMTKTLPDLTSNTSLLTECRRERSRHATLLTDWSGSVCRGVDQTVCIRSTTLMSRISLCRRRTSLKCRLSPHCRVFVGWSQVELFVTCFLQVLLPESL